MNETTTHVVLYYLTLSHNHLWTWNFLISFLTQNLTKGYLLFNNNFSVNASTFQPLLGSKLILSNNEFEFVNLFYSLYPSLSLFCLLDLYQVPVSKNIDTSRGYMILKKAQIPSDNVGETNKNSLHSFRICFLKITFSIVKSKRNAHHTETYPGLS